MRKLFLFLMVLLVAGLGACGDDGEVAEPGGDQVAGDPAAGEEIYHQVASPACDTCHSLEPGEDLVGPSLDNSGAVAATRVDGMSAEEYLRQSIVDPNAHIVEGYGANIMPATYETQLSDEQLNDLVAFLMTQ